MKPKTKPKEVLRLRPQRGKPVYELRCVAKALAIRKLAPDGETVKVDWRPCSREELRPLFSDAQVNVWLRSHFTEEELRVIV